MYYTFGFILKHHTRLYHNILGYAGVSKCCHTKTHNLWGAKIVLTPPLDQLCITVLAYSSKMVTTSTVVVGVASTLLAAQMVQIFGVFFLPSCTYVLLVIVVFVML